MLRELSKEIWLSADARHFRGVFRTLRSKKLQKSPIHARIQPYSRLRFEVAYLHESGLRATFDDEPLWIQGLTSQSATIGARNRLIPNWIGSFAMHASLRGHTWFIARAGFFMIRTLLMTSWTMPSQTRGVTSSVSRASEPRSNCGIGSAASPSACQKHRQPETGRCLKDLFLTLNFFRFTTARNRRRNRMQLWSRSSAG